MEKIIAVPLDTLTLSFYGTVGANSNKTLVSKWVDFPFTFEGVTVQFALNTNRKLKIRCVIATDDSEPTTWPMTGHSVLETIGQVDYVVGDDEPIKVRHRVAIEHAGSHIKVYAENTDSYEHTVVAQVEISRGEPLGKREKKE